MIQTVDFQTAWQMLRREPEAVLLDVREEDEYVSGHAEGAVLLSVNKINRDTAAERIASLSTPVLVYCRSGFRSRRAAGKLNRLGYARVYDIGSLSGWPYGITYGME